MVFQQNCYNYIQGTANINDIISFQVLLNGKIIQEGQIKLQQEQFNLIIEPIQGSFDKYDIIVKQNNGQTLQYIINNVMFGEVYLFSGQSNMEWWLKNDFEGKNEQMTEDDNIRVFFIRYDQYQTKAQLQWNYLSSVYMQDKSSLAYFVMKHIKKDVPYGIILCYLGGSAIESWVPVEILQINKQNLLMYNKFVYDSKDYSDFDKMKRQNGQLFQNYVELKNFQIKKVIYYQGEANIYRYQEYAFLLQQLIKEWRNYFSLKENKNIIIQFYIIEIATNLLYNPFFIRQQRYQQKIVCDQDENVHLISHTDNDTLQLATNSSIHPIKKQLISKRVVFMIENEKKNIVFDKYIKKEEEIEIFFKNVKGKLKTGNQTKQCKSFFGQKGYYIIPLEAEIKEKSIVIKNTKDLLKIHYGNVQSLQQFLYLNQQDISLTEQQQQMLSKYMNMYYSGYNQEQQIKSLEQIKDYFINLQTQQQSTQYQQIINDFQTQNITQKQINFAVPYILDLMFYNCNITDDDDFPILQFDIMKL